MIGRSQNRNLLTYAAEGDGLLRVDSSMSRPVLDVQPSSLLRWPERLGSAKIKPIPDCLGCWFR